MANTQRVTKKTPEVIIQQIDIRQIQRNTVDIDKWRTAIRSAESTTNPNRTQLYDLYSDILLDAHLSSAIDKRKTAVIKTPVVFNVDGKEDDAINLLIRAPWFQDMLTDLLDARFWGHTLLEFQFMPDGSISYNLIPRKHVDPQRAFVKIGQSDSTGIPYREPPYINFCIEAGENDDLGLLMKSAQYVIYKRNCFADYAQHAEMFGQPLRKGKYNPYDENSRLLLKQSLEEMGSSPWAIYPEGTDIEFVEAKSPSGSGDLYGGLIELNNNEISKLILGQTLTTESGSKGARSLGDVHMQVQQDIHYADRLFLKNILNNQFRKLLLLHGFKTEKGEFDFVDSESLPVGERIMVDEKLKEIIPMSDDYFYETYGVPKPDNYDELKKKLDEKNARPFAQQQQQPQSEPQPQNRKKGKGLFSSFF